MMLLSLTMIAILYEIGLFLFFCISFPKALYQRLVLGKYRGTFLLRFGIGFPKIEKKGRPLVWIHAVSLGETKAVVPLAKQIYESLENPLIVISSVTETGHAEAKKSIPFAAHHVYLPIDFRFIIGPIMRRIAPDLVLLTETDFWLNFLKSAKKAGAKIVVVNGKLSERSARRYQRLAFITKPLWQLIDLFCVQSNSYKERFESAGVPSDRLYVTGNLKLDSSSSHLKGELLDVWRQKFRIMPDHPVLVVGSTHAPEEKIFLDVLPELWCRYPHLKVLLIPRHPERFDSVAELCAQASIPFSRYSQNNISEKLVLVDEMGILQKCYQLADVAFVGGSFTEKVGGHNILEPCAFGVPVLFGPHMHAQPDLVKLVMEYQAGVQTDSFHLVPALSELLANSEQRLDFGQAGIKLMNETRGATMRTLSVMKTLLKGLSIN